MTRYRLLRAADRPSEPWKNGGGETREVIASPADAGTSDFDWRISIADVVEDGPFSIFTGVERILTVIDGGLALTFETGARSCTLDSTSEPFAFSGDVAVRGCPTQGPAKDVNVMVRSSRFEGRVTRIAAADGLTLGDDAGGVAVLLALDAIRFDLSGDPIALDPMDAIVLWSRAELSTVSGAPHRLILAEIRAA